jgi:hypothetical protein
VTGAGEPSAADSHGRGTLQRGAESLSSGHGRAVAVAGRRCVAGGSVPVAVLDPVGAGCIAIAAPALRMDGWS